MAENKTKTESKSKNENAMTDYIDLMIGSDGAFTFHGFGKLDGITIELPDKAIRKLVPAMVSYLWQKMYWVPMHFTQKQRKALSSIAFEDIEAMVAGYREEGRRRKEADAQAKQMIGFDKSRFEALADDANDRWTVEDAKREVKDEFAFAFTRLADRTHGRCQRVDTITGRCSWVIDDPDLDRLLDEVAEGIISAGVLR